MMLKIFAEGTVMATVTVTVMERKVRENIKENLQTQAKKLEIGKQKEVGMSIKKASPPFDQ